MSARILIVTTDEVVNRDVGEILFEKFAGLGGLLEDG